MSPLTGLLAATTSHLKLDCGHVSAAACAARRVLVNVSEDNEDKNEKNMGEFCTSIIPCSFNPLHDCVIHTASFGPTSNRSSYGQGSGSEWCYRCRRRVYIDEFEHRR